MEASFAIKLVLCKWKWTCEVESYPALTDLYSPVEFMSEYIYFSPISNGKVGSSKVSITSIRQSRSTIFSYTHTHARMHTLIYFTRVWTAIGIFNLVYLVELFHFLRIHSSFTSISCDFCAFSSIVTTIRADFIWLNVWAVFPSIRNLTVKLKSVFPFTWLYVSYGNGFKPLQIQHGEAICHLYLPE